MNMLATKTITVDTLARVEGEGALRLHVQQGEVAEVELRIFEPPRFFEGFLQGRSYHEAPDITARICGICPVAYQMSAVHALERAFDVEVKGPLRALRRLLYCGEWIESHALHIFMLHAPDFLGYDDAIQMARDHPEIVERALKLKQVGNDIVALLGGREIHPINVCVGGFYRLPPRQAWRPLIEKLKAMRDVAVDAVAWTAQLPFPDFTRDYEFVALRHPDEYPMNEGRLISNYGLDIDVADFEQHIHEEHLPYSTALHAAIVGRNGDRNGGSNNGDGAHAAGGGHYLVGPLARYSLNYDKLSPIAQDAARAAGLGPTCYNPFQSIVVRAVETLYAVDEALRILESLVYPELAAIPYAVRAGVGHAVTEAPRGILYHRYTVDDAGLIEHARIVPPTAQNQATIEDDLRAYVPGRAHLPLNELTWQCEQAIRNYDPCISCSAHYLRLEIVDDHVTV